MVMRDLRPDVQKPLVRFAVPVDFHAARFASVSKTHSSRFWPLAGEILPGPAGCPNVYGTPVLAVYNRFYRKLFCGIKNQC